MTGDGAATRDAQDLHHFGYAQELFRTMGGFSNFAISFSIISIITGVATQYDYGLEKGGPAEILAVQFFAAMDPRQRETPISDRAALGQNLCVNSQPLRAHGVPAIFARFFMAVTRQATC